MTSVSIGHIIQTLSQREEKEAAIKIKNIIKLKKMCGGMQRTKR